MTQDAIAAAMAAYWDCEHESEADARVAFVASLAARGFALVPVEPTNGMIEEGVAKWLAEDTPTLNNDAAIATIWRAMLAAAQEDSRD